jgi:hypothetical protein
MSLYSDKEFDEIISDRETMRRVRQFGYYKINKSIKRNSLSVSIVATGLGAILSNPTLMYLGASVYQAQFDSS